jgi:serine/threonine-protein phosphatase 2A regulatory subunit B
MLPSCCGGGGCADKTIKLWKIFDKQLKVVSSMNVELGRYGGPVHVPRLRVPSLGLAETTIVAAPRRVYANAHAYHVNSVSVNSDGESFLSADDLRVNLWQYGDSKVALSTCMGIFDIFL